MHMKRGVRLLQRAGKAQSFTSLLERLGCLGYQVNPHGERLFLSFLQWTPGPLQHRKSPDLLQSVKWHKPSLFLSDLHFAALLN